MSHQLSAPLFAAASFLAVMTVGSQLGNAADPRALTTAVSPPAAEITTAAGNQVTLHSTTGTTIYQISDPQTRTFRALVGGGGGRRVALRDGTYRLTNGGAIRVRNGKIIWDEFGIVEKIGHGVTVYHSGDNGG